jgi:hypothetical protein
MWCWCQSCLYNLYVHHCVITDCRKLKSTTLISWKLTNWCKTLDGHACTHIKTALISGLRRDADEICGLLGNYTASCGNYLPHDAV